MRQNAVLFGNVLKSLQTTILNLMKIVDSSLRAWKTLLEKEKCYKRFLLSPTEFSKDL